MAFKKLVRFDQGGEAKFGDLLSENKNGFVVKPLEGSIEAGFKESDASTVEVTKVSLHDFQSDKFLLTSQVAMSLAVDANYNLHWPQL